jgi:hypothetical protein
VDRPRRDWAGHTPSVNQLTSPSSVFDTKEDIINFWESRTLQDGYAYSAADSLEIHRLSDPIYYLDFDYSHYNDADELLYEESSIYLYGKETDSWKIFFNGQEVGNNLS